MADDKPKNPWESDGGPLETLAAASALGITVATQAMGFWLSVLSGVTAGARDAHSKAPEAEAPRKAEPKAEAPKPRPSAEIVPLKPKAAEAKPISEAPAPAPEGPAPKPEVVKAEPVAAPVTAAPVRAPEHRPAAEKTATKAKAPAEPKASAPKPAAKPKAAASKPVARKVETKPAAAPVAAKPAVATVAAKPAAAKPVVAPVAKLTPDEFRRPQAQDKPEQPDDLKTIKGLGPKLEVTLNGLGIWKFAQIAALEPAEVAWLDDYLGLSGRIARDGWIEAAKAGGTHG